MAERKKTIALDCDGVLIDINKGLHPFHNRHFGTRITAKDLATYNLDEIWQCSREEVVRRVYCFYHSPEFMDLVPVEGAVEGVSELKEKYGLVIVSTRPLFLLDKTRLSMERYFSECFDDIHLTDTVNVGEVGKKKSQVCLDLDIDTLVDDHFNNALDAAEHGIRSILFRGLWNLEHTDSELEKLGITPANNWEEVVRLLKYG